MRTSQLARCLEAAALAAARGDYAAAADAYRAAAKIAPGDIDIRRQSDEAQRRVEVMLAEGYLKQAHYEAAEGRWTEAAWSYSKACSVLPENAMAHERVAFTTLMTGGNARRAVEFARRAVELDPADVEIRLTLARAYFVVGLEKSGRGELDRARVLASGDARILARVDEVLEQARRHGRAG